MTEKNNEVAYRLLDPSEHNFIYNSFLKSYRDSPMVKGVPNTIYFKKQHDLIELFLVDPRSRAIVACNAQDPEQIYGYILAQSRPGDAQGDVLVVHWVYVKQPFRNLGIAKQLFAKLSSLPGERPTAAVQYTHRVKTVDRLLQSYPHVTFNPYLLIGA